MRQAPLPFSLTAYDASYWLSPYLIYAGILGIVPGKLSKKPMSNINISQNKTSQYKYIIAKIAQFESLNQVEHKPDGQISGQQGSQKAKKQRQRPCGRKPGGAFGASRNILKSKYGGAKDGWN